MPLAVQVNTGDHTDKEYGKPERWVKPRQSADERQRYRNAQKAFPVNSDRPDIAGWFRDGNNWRRSYRFLGSFRLGFAGWDPDLRRATGWAKRGLIFDLAPAAIAVVFHDFKITGAVEVLATGQQLTRCHSVSV